MEYFVFGRLLKRHRMPGRGVDNQGKKLLQVGNWGEKGGRGGRGRARGERGGLLVPKVEVVVREAPAERR